jgi:adenylate kinase
VPLDVLLLGVQGSGKGTQAKRLASEYDIVHLSTGDMLRRAIAEGNELGRKVEPILDAGDLVPDELMIELIRDRIQSPATADGFILDGFPRTMAQADALDAMLSEIDRPLAVVFELQIPDEVAIERLRKRAVEEGRSDDTPEAISKRIALYHQQTKPLVAHYRLAGNLVGIHGDRPVNEVFAEVQQAIEQAKVSGTRVP